MKILLIEDDSNKEKQVQDLLNEIHLSFDLSIKRSYQSGLKEILENNYGLILLDMQLPTFDIKSGEDGHRFRKTAGMDILNEMKRKKINSKVIIITQFETFGEGDNYIDLKHLKLALKENYSANYLETVYYNASQKKWKSELTNLIKQVLK